MKYFTTAIVAVLTANLIVFRTWECVAGLMFAMVMHTTLTMILRDKGNPREIEELKTEVEKAIGETKRLSLKLGFR